MHTKNFRKSTQVLLPWNWKQEITRFDKNRQKPLVNRVLLSKSCRVKDPTSNMNVLVYL